MTELYDGPYRLTVVGDQGITSTKKIEKWSRAYSTFQAVIKLPHVRYALLWELSEDEHFNELREEWVRKK